jgi:hypothetical protein
VNKPSAVNNKSLEHSEQTLKHVKQSLLAVVLVKQHLKPVVGSQQHKAHQHSAP